MTNNDDFDSDLDMEESVDEATQEAFDETPEKKGSGLVFKLILLAVIAGGSFIGVQKFGDQIPFLKDILASKSPVKAAVQNAAAPAENVPPPPVMMPPPVVPPVAAQTAAVTPLSAPTAQPVAETAIEDAEALLATTSAPPAVDTAIDSTAVSALAPAVISAEAPSDAAAPAMLAVETAVEKVIETVPSSDAGAVTPPAEGAGETPETPVADVATVISAPVATSEAAPVVPGPGISSETAVAETHERLQKLEDALVSIEQRLNEMQGKVTDTATVDQLRAELAALKKNSDTTAPAAAAVAEAAEPPPVPKARLKTPAAPKKSASVVKSKTVPAPVWILKSAKPGTAWISEKGSSELKVVSVGDTLSGLGKITAVVKDSAGRWSVNGTKGQIHQ